MAMTKLEQSAQKQITNILNKQGYPTYARLFQKFDLNLTNDPNVIGYMQVDKARIVLNKGLSTDQVSTIVRHEILHEYLTHFARSNKWKTLNPNKKISHELVNIAADYEISNKGYTDSDKNNIRNILLNDNILRGLVTEDDYPDLADKSFEEILDYISDKSDQLEDKIKQSNQFNNTGDENIQQAEELERQANAVSDDAGEQIKQNTPSDKSDNTGESDILGKKLDQNGEKADQISKEADQISKEADQLGKEADQINSNTNEPFKSTEDIEKQEKIAKRIVNLKKELEDISTKQQIKQETEHNIDQDSIAKKARDLAKYRQDPINRFITSLNKYVRNITGFSRGATWSHINKKYIYSGALKKGVARRVNTKIPSINVYFDVSGSWDDEKIAYGERAISSINNYVRQGLIKVNLYYFSNNVHGDRQAARAEGGTEGQPILDHIKVTKPDNVIIMTDDDISDCKSQITVDGMVWFIFVNGISGNLKAHLHGARGIEEYIINL